VRKENALFDKKTHFLIRKRTFFARAILMYAIKKFDGQFKPRQARDQQTNKQTNKRTKHRQC
jgi:hypothetical protein